MTNIIGIGLFALSLLIIAAITYEPKNDKDDQHYVR